jgi:hypothetical protein
MFAELFLTPESETFQNFAFFPEKKVENFGKILTHKMIFEPKVNHTATLIVLYLSNSRFKFIPTCEMSAGFQINN